MCIMNTQSMNTRKLTRWSMKKKKQDLLKVEMKRRMQVEKLLYKHLMVILRRKWPDN